MATLEGSVRSLLGAERTMLNFLSHLSGVATQARRFAQAVEGTGATVVDTRKTTPGLRSWEKKAVVYGGCANHRYGLFDLVLIKNNHLKAAGGVRRAVRRAQEARPHYLRIEVEVESADELREALEAGADIIMLDDQSAPVAAHSGCSGSRPQTRCDPGSFRRGDVGERAGGGGDRSGHRVHERPHHGGSGGQPEPDPVVPGTDPCLMLDPEGGARCC